MCPLRHDYVMLDPGLLRGGMHDQRDAVIIARLSTSTSASSSSRLLRRSGLCSTQRSLRHVVEAFCLGGRSGRGAWAALRVCLMPPVAHASGAKQRPGYEQARRRQREDVHDRCIAAQAPDRDRGTASWMAALADAGMPAPTT